MPAAQSARPTLGSAMDGSAFFRAASGESESRYQVSHVIGRGSYGTVCAAVDRRTGENVAIKHIDRVFADKADTVRIIRELRFLRHLKHPNIVTITDVLLPSTTASFDDIYIVFELLDTDLGHMIRSKTSYGEPHRQWLLYQLLAGIKHIHAAGVFHRDLKPANLLLNVECDLKICDFGLARADYPGQKQTVFWTDYIATRWYRAPELICSYFTKYTTAIDVWAVGCIFAELVLRRPLFPGRDVFHQLDLITDLLGKPTAEEIEKVRSEKARKYLSAMPPKPKRSLVALCQGADPLAVHLLSRMLCFDPANRISAAEAMQHDYFAKFRAVAREPPPPSPLAKEDFVFEKQFRVLSTEVLRDLLLKEILVYHPDYDAEAAYRGTAESEVHSQVQELQRGVGVSAGPTSLPMERTSGLVEQAAAAAARPGAAIRRADSATNLTGMDESTTPREAGTVDRDLEYA